MRPGHGQDSTRKAAQNTDDYERTGDVMTINKEFPLLAVCLGGLLLAGCVMTEKYEAEKARSLNFQRLLAQEEKRTGDLDSELKRVKREASEQEARNREMAAQLRAVREQLVGVQEETDALREAAALMEKSREGLRRSRQPALRSKRFERATVAPGADQFSETPKAGVSKGEMAETGSPVYHEVRPGETLFRLSRQHGIGVQQIKEWNNLHDDLIEVGQTLIVGYK